MREGSSPIDGNVGDAPACIHERLQKPLLRVGQWPSVLNLHRAIVVLHDSRKSQLEHLRVNIGVTRWRDPIFRQERRADVNMPLTRRQGSGAEDSRG